MTVSFQLRRARLLQWGLIGADQGLASFDDGREALNSGSFLPRQATRVQQQGFF
jgi:hypothetical protein